MKASSSKDSTVTFGGGGGGGGGDPTGCTALLTPLERSYVYGPHYIDEQVAQFNQGGGRYYVLQDANYNVVALTDAFGAIHRQFSYEPYGDLFAAEKGPTATAVNMNSEDLAKELDNWHFHGTVLRDLDTGLDYYRARSYSPSLGRFIQRDPNELALLFATALSMNAQTQLVFAAISAEGQYVEGMNPYAFAMCNPIIHTDPNGQFNPLFFIAGAIFGALGTAMDIYANARDLDMTGGQIAARLAAGAIVGGLFGAGLGALAPTVGTALGISTTAAEGTLVGMLGGSSLIHGTVGMLTADDELESALSRIEAANGGLVVLGGLHMMRVGQIGGQGFRSFSAFKRAVGPAGEGMQWHHLVEQTPGNIARFGAESIHNTANLIRLDVTTHIRVSAYYSSKRGFTGGLTVRQWLSTQSYEQQLDFGLKRLRDFGWTP